MGLRARIYCLVLGLLLTTQARTQTREYIYNRLSLQDGLLSNNVLSLWQDEKGFIWIGTENGLQRYDGYNFRTTLQRRIDQIVSDGKKRVWVRSGNIVGIFNTNNFSFQQIRYEETSGPIVPASLWIHTDSRKRPYLVITEKNCQYYDETEGQFTVKANPFSIPDSVRVIDVIDDTLKNRFWVTSFHGLGYWDKSTRQYYSASKNPQHDPLVAMPNLTGIISKFFIDKSHRYWVQHWIGSNMKFFCYDSRNNKFTNDTSGLADAGNGSYFDVYGFAEYTDTSTIVYGMNVLRMRENGIFQEFRDTRNNPYGIHFNTTHAVMQDRERILWIATDDGLYNTTASLHQNLHVVIDQQRGRGSIIRLMEDDKGLIWVCTWGRGVVVLDDERREAHPIKALRELSAKDGFTQLVWSIAQMPDRQIWLGAQEGRLMIYDPSTEKAKLLLPKAFNNSTIRQMIADKYGNLWFGLNNGFVIKCQNPSGIINDSAFKLVHDFDGHISKLLVVNKDQLWIGVNGKGIYVIDPQDGAIRQTLDRSNTPSDIMSNIQDILPVNDSIYLLGGNHLGIYNAMTGNIESVTGYNNMPLGTVHTLQTDEAGDCWLGTSNGIFKYNVDTKVLIKYSQRDGLLTIYNSSYIPETSVRLKNNRLVFAGNQHLVAFDPAQYRMQSVPPDVLITGFQLNNRYLPMDSLQKLKRVRLPYTGNSFNLEFAALSFLQHGKLSYEYKLEGSNEDWATINTPVPVKYNLLPHGNYEFLVRAKNGEGVYSKNISRLAIHIAPPFWRSVWFYLMAAAVIGILLYYLHRLRVERLLHVEKVRSRLARDLHDDMGSTLSTINILSNIALQQTPLEEKTSKDYMSTINSSTTQMMESMDDIVWSINPVNDPIAKVLARMKEVAGANLEPGNIDYEFITEEGVKELNLSMEWRRDIFLVFKEALNNIIKYSQASRVVITLKKMGRQFILVIEDNGVGFDLDARTSATRGNGLKNMRKRAENLQGSLQVESSPGSGTRLTLSVPIA